MVRSCYRFEIAPNPSVNNSVPVPTVQYMYVLYVIGLRRTFPKNCKTNLNFAGKICRAAETAVLYSVHIPPPALD